MGEGVLARLASESPSYSLDRRGVQHAFVIPKVSLVLAGLWQTRTDRKDDSFRVASGWGVVAQKILSSAW